MGEPRRPVSRQRDFALFWLGQGVSDLGTALNFVVVPLVAVVTLHASPLQVGVLGALQWLPWLLIGLPAGAWVDRHRARPLLLAADAVRLVAVAGVPLAAALGVITLGQLFAVAAVVGLATVIFQVAYQTYLPRLVDDADLLAANSLLQGSEAVAQVAGPGLAALLVQLVRAPFALAADAASYAVSLAGLLAIRRREPPPARAARRRLRAEIAEGIAVVRGDPLLRTLTIAPAIGNFCFAGVEAVWVVFLVRTVGVSAPTVGVVLALVSAGSVLGAAVAVPVSRRFGSARAVWAGMAATSPFALLMPLARPGAGLVPFVAGGVVLLAGVLVYNVAVGTFRQRYCPPAVLGRVVASMRFVLFGTAPLGAVAGGALASAFGARAALWVLVVVNLGQAAALVASPLRRLRDLPAAMPAADLPPRVAT